jgi:hypothetical protein
MDMRINYDRKGVFKGILVSAFLLFFFSYFFFFITSNAISGKAIAQEEQISLSLPKVEMPEVSINQQKLINFFLIFGSIIIAILIIFYLSKVIHKRMNKKEHLKRVYSTFKSLH